MINLTRDKGYTKNKQLKKYTTLKIETRARV